MTSMPKPKQKNISNRTAPITISVFNNKGGVGKTTILWNLAAALGSLKKKVLVIDYDPQCNLSIATLGTEGFVAKLASSKKKPHGDTIKAFVAPFITQNKTIKPETFQPINTHTENVHVIPGDFWLNNFADQLSVGTDVISGGGLMRFLLPNEIVEALKSKGQTFDYVFIDIPPSFNTLVRSALYSSDYFLVPCTADQFSTYCVGLIGEMLPNFIDDWEQGKRRHLQSNPFDQKIQKYGQPKFGGWIFNGFDTRKHLGVTKLTAADSAHSKSLRAAVNNNLIPSLRKISTYIAVPSFVGNDEVVGIEDLNVMAPDSIQQNTPIMHLSQKKPTRENVGSGAWSADQKALMSRMSAKFVELANYVIKNFK